MKNRITHLHTGDLVLTNDIKVNTDGNTTWSLFVILGQHIIKSKNAMLYCGMVMYEVAPAHINGDSIVFDILQESISIDDTDIKLVVGKTDRICDPDLYDESLAEIVKDTRYRNRIKRLEDREIIMSLIQVLDDPALNADDDLKRCLFNIVYQRDMDAQTATECVEHISKIRPLDVIYDRYKINWSTYMYTMKHLKEIINNSMTDQ